MEDFLFWINKELKTKGWSVNRLSEHAKLSNSAVYATLSQRNAVTWEFCAAIARAFQLPPEEVFRKAGLLKSTPEQAKNSELINIANNLPASDLQLLNDFAKLLYQRDKQP